MKRKWIFSAALIVAVMRLSVIAEAAEAEVMAPAWVEKALDDLARAGVLDEYAIASHAGKTLTREEAAMFTAKAVWCMEAAPQGEALQPYIAARAEQSSVAALKQEFKQELADMGYGALELARKMPPSGERWVQISGELRYNYAFNDGPRPTIEDDSRSRLRLYGKVRLNEDWDAYTMVESDRSFFQPERRDGHLNWNRYYVRGKMGDVSVTAGHFGYLLAEGNVYDSTFQGLIAEFGDPLKIRVGWAKTGDNGRGYLVSAHGGTLAYQFEGGLYRYDDYNADCVNTIGYMGGNYFLGRYSFGAMYLRGNLRDSIGDRDGYVLTLGYGKLKTWKPGSYSLYAKYYDQARGTYIAHTMTGSAGYMEGFKGYGMGGSYTVRDRLVYGIDYYDLRDKVTGKRSRTLWNQFTYYF